MKYLLILNLLMISLAQASLDDCIRDAKTHGSHTSPLSPVAECAEIIKSQPDKIEAKTKDGQYHLYGLGSLIYVESNGQRELLSGDQTELNDVLKIEINQQKKRFLVLQKNSVSTFKLDFIGNVTPVGYFKSPIMKNVKRVKLLDNEDMIAIFSTSSIRIINSNAETRYDVEKLKPKLLNEIKGENSQIHGPSDLLFSSAQKKIFVLDSNRLLVFPSDVKKDQAPLKIISLEDTGPLLEKDKQLFYVNSEGQEINIPTGN